MCLKNILRGFLSSRLYTYSIKFRKLKMENIKFEEKLK